MHLPPLRQRGDDILELAEFFLDGFCKKVGRAKPSWTTGAQKRLKAHHWPGNIRELRNLVERIVYLVPGETIEDSDLDFVSSPKSTLGTESEATLGIDESMTLADATDVFQQNYIEKHIERSRGNMTAAAQSLGLQRSNLYRKMKQLGMKTPE
ncbi:MAG: helix-turn-helix domain-containing protein [Pirellulales bacterium]